MISLHLIYFPFSLLLLFGDVAAYYSSAIVLRCYLYHCVWEASMYSIIVCMMAKCTVSNSTWMWSQANTSNTTREYRWLWDSLTAAWFNFDCNFFYISVIFTVFLYSENKWLCIYAGCMKFGEYLSSTSINSASSLWFDTVALSSFRSCGMAHNYTINS